MRRNAEPGDAARDYVFQAFMSGRRAERLAVRLPRAFAMLGHRDGGNKLPGDGERFRPRGYVGITGRDNYYRMSQLLGFQPKMSDLVDSPDKAVEPRIAYRILSMGMRDGLFTGRRLSDYLNDEQTDYVNARRIVNGTDNARQIAEMARAFEGMLRQAARPPAVMSS